MTSALDVLRTAISWCPRDRRSEPNAALADIEALIQAGERLRAADDRRCELAGEDAEAEVEMEEAMAEHRAALGAKPCVCATERRRRERHRHACLSWCWRCGRELA